MTRPWSAPLLLLLAGSFGLSLAAAGCAAEEGAPGTGVRCETSQECGSGRCDNGVCVDGVDPGMDVDGVDPIPDASSPPDAGPTPGDTGAEDRDTRDTGADPDGTPVVPDTGSETDGTMPPDGGTLPVGPGTDGIFQTCRAGSIDCDGVGLQCVKVLLGEPGVPGTGIPIFPDDPDLGICTRDCSPLVAEDGSARSRAVQCNELEAGGRIERWSCQAVLTDAEPGEAWDAARVGAVCRPEVRDPDGRTGDCFACNDDANCAGGLCVDYGEGGHVDRRCARRCGDGDACPAGTTCRSIAVAGGGEARVCAAALGTCTECVDRDGDGRGLGACAARDCDDADATRYVGATESCNGVDNDCDGQVDTGFASGTDAAGAPVYDTLAACGACGQACPTGINNTTYACVALDNGFACEPSCSPGFGTCGRPLTPVAGEAPSCQSITSNMSCGESCTNCAASSQACGPGGICQFTTCPEGQASCVNPAENNCETFVNTDAANCGGCGVNCGSVLSNTATFSCSGGQCQVGTCAEGFANCNAAVPGCETRTQTDARNCGTCGNSCPGNQICTNGRCGCPSGQLFCNGNCVPESNVNCGSCGTTCTGGASCTGGVCFNPCEGVFCGACAFCSAGECVPIGDPCGCLCGPDQICCTRSGGFETIPFCAFSWQGCESGGNPIPF